LRDLAQQGFHQRVSPFIEFRILGFRDGRTAVLRLTVGRVLGDRALKYLIATGTHVCARRRLFHVGQPITVGSTYDNLVLNGGGGNVGIGTTSPNAKLSVWSASSANITLGHDNTTGLHVLDWTDGSQYVDFNGSLFFRDGINGSGNTSPLTLRDGGNIGIGSTSPAQLLSVAGKVYTTGGIQFADGSLQTAAAAGASAGTQGQFAFYNANGTTVSGTSTLFITQAGNIGIGTTTPDFKLTVTGDDVGINVNTLDTSGPNAKIRLQLAGITGIRLENFKCTRQRVQAANIFASTY